LCSSEIRYAIATFMMIEQPPYATVRRNYFSDYVI